MMQQFNIETSTDSILYIRLDTGKQTDVLFSSVCMHGNPRPTGGVSRLATKSITDEQSDINVLAKTTCS